jgi:ATP-dependent Lon protease
MGEVMTESASIAWSYVKKKVAQELNLNQSYFRERDFHLHIPAGAIPKDGPSAGVTMATALYSLITGKVAKQRIAMTGELSLVGKVLPVGGIKEKILAARRAGIRTVILPKLNKKDIFELPKYALKDMELRFVSHVEEVFQLALEETPEEKSKARAKTRPKRVLRMAKKKKQKPRATRAWLT